jgi:tRNA pseudouridine32 synthase/23S rRNA pseudouridine746 synthase/23S rRNA pseudouridine1911/1915/1917 synthase
MTTNTDEPHWQQVRAERTVYVDEHVLVIDKPAGISLVGERGGTDLMQQAREAGDWVMPAHRIDKVTSGLVLLARDQQTHGILTRQFSDRTVAKDYLAVVRDGAPATSGTIDLPLSVGRKSRVRVAAERAAIRQVEPGRWSVTDGEVFGHVRVYPAVSRFVTIAEHGQHAALVLRPQTGRRHQLRVHLAWIGHPIEGDPLFCRPPGPRTHLHAWRLSFRHPTSGERLTVRADPDVCFWHPMGESLTPADSPFTADS